MDWIIDLLANVNPVLAFAVGVAVLAVPAAMQWNSNGRPGGWMGLIGILFSSLKTIFERVGPDLAAQGRIDTGEQTKIRPSPDDLKTLRGALQWAQTDQERELLLKCFGRHLSDEDNGEDSHGVG